MNSSRTNLNAIKKARKVRISNRRIATVKTSLKMKSSRRIKGDKRWRKSEIKSPVNNLSRRPSRLLARRSEGT